MPEIYIVVGNYRYEILSIIASKSIQVTTSGIHLSLKDLESNIRGKSFTPYPPEVLINNLKVTVTVRLYSPPGQATTSDLKTDTFEFPFDIYEIPYSKSGKYTTCKLNVSNAKELSVHFDRGYNVTSANIRIELTGYSEKEAKVRLDAKENTWNPNGEMLSTVNILGKNYNVVDAEGCFENASFVTKVKNLSGKLTNMRRCFKDCHNLSGNIKVSCEPTNYTDIFYGTSKDIYIVNDGLSSWNVWEQYIADYYYYNVHYEATDNARPQIAQLTALRTNAQGGTAYDPTGRWAHIKVIANVYQEYIPDGWTNAASKMQLLMNGTEISPTWTINSETIVVPGYDGDYAYTKYTYETWLQVNQSDVYNFKARIYEQTKNEIGTVKQARNSSLIQVTLPRAYALVDYYHDNNTNTEGIAFGKYADSANLLDVNMPALLRAKLSLELDDNTTSGTDYKLINLIGSLEWNDILS